MTHHAILINRRCATCYRRLEQIVPLDTCQDSGKALVHCLHCGREWMGRIRNEDIPPAALAELRRLAADNPTSQ